MPAAPRVRQESHGCPGRTVRPAHRIIPQPASDLIAAWNAYQSSEGSIRASIQTEINNLSNTLGGLVTPVRRCRPISEWCSTASTRTRFATVPGATLAGSSRSHRSITVWATARIMKLQVTGSNNVATGTSQATFDDPYEISQNTIKLVISSLTPLTGTRYFASTSCGSNVYISSSSPTSPSSTVLYDPAVGNRQVASFTQVSSKAYASTNVNGVCSNATGTVPSTAYQVRPRQHDRRGRAR